MSGELTAIRTAGGMLTGSLLARVGRGDATLGGMGAADYHLPAGQSPREAANRAWSYLSGMWPAFRDAVTALPDSNAAVRVTREQWLLHVFGQLGYGRLQTTPAGGLAAGDKGYPISHVWGATPIHLLGWNVDLDRRTKGVAGAAERAPHALVQEFLNRSDEHLWGVVSNGQVLRLLRDSSALSAQSFVEFDLVAIFDGELFSDFVVLFLLLHQSRVEVGGGDAGRDVGERGPADCWLERWRGVAATSGTRAMASLRDGVKRAIELLGTGFLQHPDNMVLRHQVGLDEVDDPEVSAAEFQQGLLRLVYRLLFLFVAEDRGALLDPAADLVARERYSRFYSTARLRRMARRRRGTQHEDLWVALTLVIERLGAEHGCPELGLPGIGGLFDDRGTEFLTASHLSNQALLAAVRELSVVQPKGEARQPVDYKNLGAEELGGIYESLLELVPRLNLAERTLTLELLAGNERKTTGSYYTPSSLIDLVLDETLTPLLDEAERADDPEAALLGLTVCDPACGSGHILVAAARRLAERLAVARSGEHDPTPTDVGEAMRDVVTRCLYGVDLNPLAAELAKVSLWLDSMEAGKPLSFLDSHIKVGNSLLGTTPALLPKGVPESAYVALEGDDKKATTLLKKQNRQDLKEREAEREGADLFDVFAADGAEAVSNASMATKLGEATAVRTQSLAGIHAVEKRYAQYLANPELARERLRADTWCAAFVQVKGEGSPPITTATVDEAARGELGAAAKAEVERLQAQYGFFHWHLEFPEIFDVGPATSSEEQGWRGGFAAMLGNPPWERVKLQEQEFFAQRDPEVAGAKNAAARKTLITALVETNPDLDREWRQASRVAEATSHVLRKSGRYPLCGVGDVNTYAVFAELFRSSVRFDGRMGVITPTGLATDATTSAFFADTVKHKRLAAFYDFENEAKIFPGVHNQFRFAIAVISGGRPIDGTNLAFYTRYVQDTVTRRFGVTPKEVLLLNPNT
ncbi:MAG: N-6 DNA methylase, partial [Dermatophilaceae bacterium]